VVDVVIEAKLANDIEEEATPLGIVVGGKVEGDRDMGVDWLPSGPRRLEKWRLVTRCLRAQMAVGCDSEPCGIPSGE
jgi:hypothetical protein